MENNRFIKLFSFFGIFLAFPLFIFAYSEKTTHPALTDEIVDLFNLYYPKLKLSEEEKELLKKGSIEEDWLYRPIYHFYDPVYNRGLEGTTISSKEWAMDTVAQASVFRPLAGAITGLFGAPSDYSWERAIYDYVWKDKERGLVALGHILHLIEDASVPDHTRNDPHPPNLDTSPYEFWAKKFTPENLEGLATMIYHSGHSHPVFNSLNEHFDSLATYSNNKFFSKDRIFYKDYDKPIVNYYSNGFGFYDKEEKYLLIRKISKFDGTVEYSLIDNKNRILTDYWSHLSKQAVLHGVEVVRLFFEEAEKERKNWELFAKNKNLMDRVEGNVLNSWGLGLGEAPPKIAEIPPEAFEPVPPPASPVIEVELQSEPVAIVPESATSDDAQVDVKPLLVRQAGPKFDNEENVKHSVLNTLIPIPAGAGGGGAPAEEEEKSPAPPADTTGPAVSLSVSECSNSLSAEGCLLASSTLALSWSSSDSDLDHYIIECEVAGAACSGFDFASTAATSTNYTLPTDDSAYAFKAEGVDKSGNTGSQVTKTVDYYTRPVVINEIAWAGTATSSFDEWIELYNRTSKTVSLTNWALYAEDGVPYVNLSSTIAAGGYYLIERGANDTVSDIAADLVTPFSGTGSGSGLSNSGEVLILSQASTTIDQTPSSSACSGWCAGLVAGFLTMERIDPDTSGTASSNWGSHNGTVKNGQDAGGAALAGTARARNSLNYLITAGTNLTVSKTLKKSKSPYIIKDGVTVNSGVTLTIEPGVVIKFYDADSYLTSQGAIKANGASADKIVFTSFKDDEYGGDLNADAASTTPAALDWRTIEIQGPGTEFDYAVIRYGGKWYSGITFGRTNLKVINTSVSIKKSTIEEAGIYGLWLDGASGTVEGNTFKNNKNDNAAAGIYLIGGSATITSNTFDTNKVGLKIEPDGSNNPNASSAVNNTFTSNQNEAINLVRSYPTFSGNSASSNGINGIVAEGNQNQDYTFVANLPYVINVSYTVNSGKTLTINSGTVVKFKDNQSSLAVDGKILANGTSASKIVFTSLKDDVHGGDTNNDGSTSSPQAGDWVSVQFNSGAATSTLDNVTMRYGGGFFNASGAVRISGSSHEIKNSLFELNNFNAIWSSGTGTTTVSNTAFRNNQTGIKVESPHVFVNGGGIIFENNTTNTSPVELVP